MKREKLTRLIVTVIITVVVIMIWWFKGNLSKEVFFWAIMFWVFALISLYTRFFLWLKNLDAPMFLFVVVPVFISFFITTGPALIVGELLPDNLDETIMAITMFVTGLIVLVLDIIGIVRASKEYEQYTEYGEQQEESEYKYYESEYDYQETEHSNEPSELQLALATFMLDSLSDVTLEQLNAQRKRMLKTYHPDNNVSDMDTKRAQKINNAYEVLKKYL